MIFYLYVHRLLHERQVIDEFADIWQIIFCDVDDVMTSENRRYAT
jgi:hypothetical protein